MVSIMIKRFTPWFKKERQSCTRKGKKMQRTCQHTRTHPNGSLADEMFLICWSCFSLARFVVEDRHIFKSQRSLYTCIIVRKLYLCECMKSTVYYLSPADTLYLYYENVLIFSSPSFFMCAQTLLSTCFTVNVLTQTMKQNFCLCLFSSYQRW